MPTAPEILDIGRQVGRVEVGRKLVAKQARAGDGHVRIARKVAIDLDTVEQHAGDHLRRRKGGRVGKNDVHILRNIVRDTGLLDEADQEQRQAGAHADISPFTGGIHLRNEFRCANDRPGDQLRKEGDIEGHIKERPARANVAAMDIHHVGYGLKRIETDAHRQNEVQRHRSRTQAHHAGKIDKAVSKEVEVFEHAKQCERRNNAARQCELSGSVTRRIAAGCRADQIADHGDQKDQAKKTPVPGAIEDI